MSRSNAYRIARRRFASTIRENQWALPACGALVGIVLGLLLFSVDETPSDGWTITVSQARATLTALIALMFTILSLSLSLTTIALDNVSSHFSLRMLTVSVHDYRTKIATSVFAVAVSYIGVELFKLTRLGGDELTPRIPFAVAVLLIVFAGVSLFWQLNYTIQSLRLDRSLARLERVIHRAARSHQRRFTGWSGAPLPPVTDTATQVFATRSGYVTDMDLDGLLGAAREQGMTLVVGRSVGDAVVVGESLGWIEMGPDDRARGIDADVIDTMRSAVQIDAGRDVAHDVGFGLRILVDIASLALSPAVNDAHTAVQVVNEMTIVFVDLAGRDIGPRTISVDGGGASWVAGPTLIDLLGLASEQIGRYGADEPSVMAALGRLCSTVERLAPSEAERDEARAVRNEMMAGAADAVSGTRNDR